MRRLIIAIIGVLLFAYNTSAQETRIGVVNSDIIMANYPEFRRAEEQLAKDVEGWRVERAAWEAGMMEMQDDIRKKEERLGGPLSEQGKMKLRTEIDSLSFVFNQELQMKNMQEQERFNQRRAEVVSQVLAGVNEVIEELGEVEGYDLIIDSANGSIVYAREPDDLTDQLLRKLQDK
ncbi:OmpH family outer membrane protein [Calditrichota bacterium]